MNIVPRNSVAGDADRTVAMTVFSTVMLPPVVSGSETHHTREVKA